MKDDPQTVNVYVEPGAAHETRIVNEAPKESEKFFKRLSSLLNWTAALIAAYFAVYAAGYGLDSTDVHAFKRSGVALRTDNLTGCEYLEGAKGGLTPRLTATGLHMGCRK